MAFKVGDRVECLGKDEGFLDSYYEADIQSISGKRCLVKYVELLTEDGDRLIENLPLEQLRPVPPKIDPPGKDPNFQPGSYIEAYHQDGWWKGAIHKKIDDDHYLCYFLSNGIEQLKMHFSELRTCLDWINGAWTVKGAPTSATPAPQNVVHLKLPSPCTPESPSRLTQVQSKNTPPTASAASEGFVLPDDEEEDVDIETSWGVPVPAAGGESTGVAAPRLPSDEEGTVSDRGGAPSGEEVERLVAPSESLPTGSKGPGKKKGAKTKNGTARGKGRPGQTGKVPKKRKGTGDEHEGSPRKPRKRPDPAKEKEAAGSGKGASRKKQRPPDAAEPGQAPWRRESGLLALAHYMDECEMSGDSGRHNGSRGQQNEDRMLQTSSDSQRQARSKSGGLGAAPSPFGKNVVPRWGSKQRSMDDVLRRSLDSGREDADAYEWECEVDRQRKKAHKSAGKARHSAATSAGQLEPQQGCHVAPPESRHQESSLTPYRDSWDAQESVQGDGWGAGYDERPCLPTAPLWGGFENRHNLSPAQMESPPGRFSFRAAYGGILEALLRKEMPSYRREFLLAELRSELQISDRCHEKQYQRALRRISSLTD